MGASERALRQSVGKWFAGRAEERTLEAGGSVNEGEAWGRSVWGGGVLGDREM